MEKAHDKGLPKDADVKASEGVLCLLEAFFSAIESFNIKPEALSLAK